MTKDDGVLELGTRKKIYELIENRPGICIRELQRETNFAMGQLTHHVSRLLKTNLIKEESDKRFRRFFPLGLNDYDRKILSFLRKPTMRKIILFLLQHKQVNNQRLNKELCLSSATISWHIQMLKEANLVNNDKRKNKIFYSLKNKEEIAKVLITYRESFLDKLVEKFVETWGIR